MYLREDYRFYKLVFLVLYRLIGSNIIGSIFRYKRYFYLVIMIYL